MAISLIVEGTSSYCDIQFDYDSTASTIGVTATGSPSKLSVTVTGGTGGNAFVATLDCIHGRAGNVLGQGRIILVGPGSVLGIIKSVTSAQVQSANWSLGMAP